MFFILDGTPGSDISIFLARLNEESFDYKIILYRDWLSHHNIHQNMKMHCRDDHEESEGIILMRVKPEIAHKRLQSRIPKSEMSLADIMCIYQEKERFFIENKNNHIELQNLPLLILNGNIDFQTDFSQFYNHLFYIRRFVNEIKKRKEIAQGIYKEKSIRKCC